MFGAIRSQGAITLYSFTSAINSDSFKATMIRDNLTQTSLLATTVISALIATKDLLVLSCPTCLNNFGTINIYDPKTLQTLQTIKGTSKDYQYLGNQVLSRPNTDGSTQFWFTSRKSSNLQVNSVIGFKDYETQKWDFEIRYDLWGFLGSSNTDVASVSSYLNWVFYKSLNLDVIGTFQSCDYNYIEQTDNTLSGKRKCVKCPISKAFSYGFAEQQCKSCSEVASFKNNGEPILQYMYRAACPFDVVPTVGEDGKIKEVVP